MSIAVKICGITNREDAHIAADAGADFIGVIVEIEESPRAVGMAAAQHIVSETSVPIILLLEKSLPDVVKIAGGLNPYAVQLVGSTEVAAIGHLREKISCKLWKTIQIPPLVTDESSFIEVSRLIESYRSMGVDVIVLDTLVKNQGMVKKGGTGQVCDWDIAQKVIAGASLPIFLAGGITPSNVREAIKSAHPYGIDVSSGVELRPGKKDPEKILKLIQTVHGVQAASL